MISPYYLPRRCAPLEIILLKSYFYLLPRSIEWEIILLFLNPSVTNYTSCTSNKNFLANTFKKLAGKLSGTTHIMQLFYRHISRLQWDKTLKAVVIDNPRPINLEVSKWSGKIRIRRKVTKEALKYIIRRRLRVLNAIISNFKMQFNPK